MILQRHARLRSNHHDPLEPNETDAQQGYHRTDIRKGTVVKDPAACKHQDEADCDYAEFRHQLERKAIFLKAFRDDGINVLIDEPSHRLSQCASPHGRFRGLLGHRGIPWRRQQAGNIWQFQAACAAKTLVVRVAVAAFRAVHSTFLHQINIRRSLK